MASDEKDKDWRESVKEAVTGNEERVICSLLGKKAERDGDFPKEWFATHPTMPKVGITFDASNWRWQITAPTGTDLSVFGKTEGQSIFKFIALVLDTSIALAYEDAAEVLGVKGKDAPATSEAEGESHAAENEIEGEAEEDGQEDDDADPHLRNGNFDDHRFIRVPSRWWYQVLKCGPAAVRLASALLHKASPKTKFTKRGVVIADPRVKVAYSQLKDWGLTNSKASTGASRLKKAGLVTWTDGVGQRPRRYTLCFLTQYKKPTKAVEE